MSDRVFQVLLPLTSCVKTNLATAEIEVCDTFLVTGQAVALDHMGVGVAWVREADTTLAEIEGAGNTPCAATWRASIEVGIALCHPLQERPLSVDQHLDLAQGVSNAKMALWKAISCCATEWLPGNSRMKRSVVRWQPVGPQGGIVGGAWLLAVDV